VTVRVVERRRQDASAAAIMLIQAIPKSQKMEWIIQKATELGVWSIIPVMTDRGVVKLENERADHRTARWQRIANEAAKQCRTAWIPRIEPVTRFKGLMESRPRVEAMLIGSLELDAIPLKQCLGGWATRCPNSVALLIGPEGDFSPAESEAARAAGAIPVSYGTRVLRVETAAIFGLSVLAHELGTLAPLRDARPVVG
jgi:16S rRNA (uracil1498-N3)-methyltransferase